MKTCVIGIDKTNHNYRKVYGFIDAFSKFGEVFHQVDEENWNVNGYDLYFGEMKNFNCQYPKHKTVIIWSNISVLKIIEITKNNKDTNFIWAVKSPIHIEKITNKYIETFGDMYQVTPPEGQDLKAFLNVLSNSFKIDDNTYKISDNLIYTFLPCSLSQYVEDNIVEDENSLYDICYFGTTHNRNEVLQVLNFFERNNRKTITNYKIGHTNPEDVLQYYKKSKICIHQQVHPVILEIPVRLGEAMSYGCKYVSIEKIALNESIQQSPLFEHYYSTSSIKEAIETIEKLLNNSNTVKDKQEITKKFDLTYDNYAKKLINMIDNFKKN